MSEEIKQEGEFKVKPKKTKKLVSSNEPVKLNLSEGNTVQNTNTEKDVAKLDLTNTQQNAIQEQNTGEGVLGSSNQSEETGQETFVELSGMGGENQETAKTEEIETVISGPEQTTETVKIDKVDNKVDDLPSEVQKLVDFMRETGGTVEDYARLNRDYSNVDSSILLREYYKQTRPHLDNEDIDLIMEDFSWDEDLDSDTDIKKKKIAYKEELGKAKKFLNELKDRYYAEIKLRPGVSAEQQKAIDFFNRYNEEQTTIEQRRNSFQAKTNEFFSNEFKGFELNIGEKKFKYMPKDPKVVANTQSDINNFLKKFTNESGEVKDYAGYHKALYIANNHEHLLAQIYEQGKADAIKEISVKSKNISEDLRTSSMSDNAVNGLRVKVIGGDDSSRLKINK